MSQNTTMSPHVARVCMAAGCAGQLGGSQGGTEAWPERKNKLAAVLFVSRKAAGGAWASQVTERSLRSFFTVSAGVVVPSKELDVQHECQQPTGTLEERCRVCSATARRRVSQEKKGRHEGRAAQEWTGCAGRGA